jgi:hypothetical protein
LACFPVQYQETHYKDVVERHDKGLCKFAYWNGFVIGATCSRVENIPQQEKEGVSDEKNPQKHIYIMTLGVLTAYRGRRTLLFTLLLCFFPFQLMQFLFRSFLCPRICKLSRFARRATNFSRTLVYKESTVLLHGSQ